MIAVNYLALRTLTEGLLDRMPDGSVVVSTASMAGNLWKKRAEAIDELLDLDLADGWTASLQWYDDTRPLSTRACTTSPRRSSSATRYDGR